MQINVTQTDDGSIVAIVGELRLAAVADAKPDLVAALATQGALKLDLSDLGDCDTAGLQLLLMTCASARAKGKRCVTVGHTAAFRAALDRVGIAAASFALQAVARDDGQDDPGRR
jgi:anti-anti-sigma regulatory factor